MALATLSIDLVAKLAQFESDMGKAARASEKTASQIAGAFGLIKSAVGGLAAGIGVGGLVALTKSTIDSLDALNDLKDATGASIENISALEDVALRTGTSLDTVGTSLVKFNAVLKDAKPGNDAAAALEALGLSAEELKRLDPAEALRQTAVALAGFADDGNKARLTQELFGKSLREVAPFLKDLSEQAKLNATVTTEQALEAEKFNLQLFAMQKNLQDVSRSLVGPILTGMNGLIDKFKEGTKAGDGFIVTLLKQSELANLGGFSRILFGQNKATPKFLLDYNETSAESARLARQAAPPSVDFNGGAGTTKPKRGGGKPQAEQLTDAQRALSAYVDGLSRALEQTQKLSAEEEALNFLRFAGAQGQVPQVRELVLGLARQIDAQKELAEIERQRAEISRNFSLEAGDRVEKENATYRDRIKSLTEGTASDVFKRQQEDVEFLQQALARTDITLGQYTESVQKLFGINEERIEKSKSMAEELGLSFTSAFEDAIVGGKKFSDVLKGLEQDILRIVTRKLVTEPLSNAITGAVKGSEIFGGISEFFGGLFSADGGGFTGPGARSGGMDGRGGFLAMLHPNETVLDHTRGQRGGNAISITVNQSFAQGTSRATTLQAAADARRQLELGGRNL